jgi:hypothetical protein
MTDNMCIYVIICNTNKKMDIENETFSVILFVPAGRLLLVQSIA